MFGTDLFHEESWEVVHFMTDPMPLSEGENGPWEAYHCLSYAHFNREAPFDLNIVVLTRNSADQLFLEIVEPEKTVLFTETINLHKYRYRYLMRGKELESYYQEMLNHYGQDGYQAARVLVAEGEQHHLFELFPLIPPFLASVKAIILFNAQEKRQLYAQFPEVKVATMDKMPYMIRLHDKSFSSVQDQDWHTMCRFAVLCRHREDTAKLLKERGVLNNGNVAISLYSLDPDYEIVGVKADCCKTDETWPRDADLLFIDHIPLSFKLIPIMQQAISESIPVVYHAAMKIMCPESAFSLSFPNHISLLPMVEELVNGVSQGKVTKAMLREWGAFQRESIIYVNRFPMQVERINKFLGEIF